MATALESVEELHDGRRGAADEKGTVRFTKRWRARTLSRETGPIGVVVSANTYHGIPIRGQYYEERDGNYNLFARCVDLSCEPSSKHPRDWILTVNFTTAPPDAVPLRAELGKPGTQGTPRGGGLASSAKSGAGVAGGYDPGQRPADPVFRPPQISWATVRKREPLRWADRYLQAPDMTWELAQASVRPKNAAGDEFDPKPEVDRHLWRLTFTRCERFFDDDLLGVAVGCLNSTQFLNKPPYTWLLDDVSGTEEWEGLYGFWRVTYVLLYDEQTHFLDVMNAGFREIVAGVPKPILENGHTPTSPVPLGIGGARRAPGQDPLYFSYWPKGKMFDFANLGLV